MMKDEAVTIADRYLKATFGESPTLSGQRCEYRLANACIREEDDRWMIVYRVHFPDSPGTVVDGGPVVVVDPVSHVARFRGDPFDDKY